MEPARGDLGTNLLVPWSPNQHFVLFYHPGCKERILSEVRLLFLRDLYRVDRSHFVHPRLDGHHYRVHVHDPRYRYGSFSGGVRKQRARLFIKSLRSTER